MPEEVRGRTAEVLPSRLFFLPLPADAPNARTHCRVRTTMQHLCTAPAPGHGEAARDAGGASTMRGADAAEAGGSCATAMATRLKRALMLPGCLTTRAVSLARPPSRLRAEKLRS